jgi:hypothetical protein
LGDDCGLRTDLTAKSASNATAPTTSQSTKWGKSIVSRALDTHATTNSGSDCDNSSGVTQSHAHFWAKEFCMPELGTRLAFGGKAGMRHTKSTDCLD